jgi:hypothetical protein
MPQRFTNDAIGDFSTFGESGYVALLCHSQTKWPRQRSCLLNTLGTLQAQNGNRVAA